MAPDLVALVEKMDVNSEKLELRAEMKRRYAEWKSLGGPDSAAITARRIGGAIEALPSFQSAKTILLYSSMPGEVPTFEWLEKWRATRKIALPRVNGDVLELREYKPDDVVNGRFGIIEPSPDAPYVNADVVDLAVIPGVAFDSGGCRLGHGCGYYDRLLPALRCTKIGVAFPFRIVGRVPVGDSDVRMDNVIW